MAWIKKHLLMRTFIGFCLLLSGNVTGHEEVEEIIVEYKRNLTLTVSANQNLFQWTYTLELKSASPSYSVCKCAQFSPGQIYCEGNGYYDHFDWSASTGKMLIKNVDTTLSEMKFFSKNFTKTFYFKVYARPETPTCETKIQHQNQSVLVSCSTRKVFPKAICIFHTTFESLIGSQTISYTHSSYSVWGKMISSELYSTRCSVSVPVASLGVGTQSYNVTMYPNITGGEAFAVNSSRYSFNLNFPTVKVDAECSGLHEAIKPGEPAICTCVRATEGYPRGSVQWFTMDGQPLTHRNSWSEKAILDVIVTCVTSYVCKGVSYLGIDNSGFLYTPKYKTQFECKSNLQNYLCVIEAMVLFLCVLAICYFCGKRCKQSTGKYFPGTSRCNSSIIEMSTPNKVKSY